MFAPESATIDDLLDMYRARKNHRVRVSRDGSRWVVKSSGESVAWLSVWRDAMSVANAIARSHRWRVS